MNDTKNNTSFGTKKRTIILIICGLVVLLAVIVSICLFASNKSHRNESYKKVSGAAAGLDATIAFDTHCTKSCKQYNFNVYILGEDGRQVAVVQPDQQGRIQLALPAGDYIMLVGKEFGKSKLFPQERVTLKNGEQLDLKLHYEEAL